MSAFKDILKSDIENVFLNQNEFAEEHLVDGVSMKIIIDNNEMLEREKRYKKALEDGISQKQVLFYVSAAEFGRLPKIGRILMLDKRSYRVTDAIREGSVYSILLEANKS